MTSNLLHRYVGVAATCCILSMASGCVDEIEGNEPRQEPVAEAAEALSTAPVTSYTSTTGDLLSDTNGKKTVATSSGLHTVWADGGTVYYASSADGITWAPPTPIDATGAYRPAIAAASDGTLGILYIRNATASAWGPEGDVYYRWKSDAGWSTTFKVTSDPSSQVAHTPTITAHRTTMHMAWASTDSVHYLSFPANQTVPLATAASINPTTSCVRQIYHPSIAASDDAAGTGAAVVRIGYYQDESPGLDSSCTTGSSGWIVAQKPATGYWPPVGQRYGIMGMVTLSLVANKTTGDFYLVTSQYDGNVESTELHYENANDPTSTWRSEQIVPRVSNIDVATTMKGCDPILRIVYSDFSVGASSGIYGPTYYRTGIWAGAAAAAPIWTDAAPVLLDPNGSYGTALFWEKSVSKFSRQKRVFYSLFERQTFPSGSPNHALIDAYDTVANVSEPACHADTELEL